MHNFLRRTSNAAAKRLRLLARAEDGFTIIEVVMSSVIVVLIAGGVMTGIDAAGRASADLRHRSQAQELAQQDQERMRGMSSQQLANLDEQRDVTVDGTEFEVTSEGEFLSHADGGSSCGGNSADYVKVVSTVDWQPLNKRPPVVVQSIITPPIGGTLLARVVDQSDVGVPGATVSVTGPENFSATTDVAGCAIFAGMEVGDYVVTASRSGYVDWDGETSVTADAHVSTSETAIPLLAPLAEAGAIEARFITHVDGSQCDQPPDFYCVDQRARSLSWFNFDAYDGASQTRNSVGANGSLTIRTPASGFDLFPFAIGTDTTDNWAVWGGSCDSAKPPADLSFATVNPGSPEATPQVLLPALLIKVTYEGAHVAPDNVKLTDSCPQSWRPVVRPGPPDITSGSTYDLLGTLRDPGQPYAPAGDPYSICVDYDPPGTGPVMAAGISSPNDNFDDGTVVPTINLTSGSTPGTCP